VDFSSLVMGQVFACKREHPRRFWEPNRRLHYVVLGQNRRGASSEIIIIINHHVGLIVLTDVMSPITTSV